MGLLPYLLAVTLAAPVLTVKARPSLELDDVGLRGDVLLLVGRIVDAASGDPLPGVPVDLWVAGRESVFTTGEGGAFVVTVPAARGAYTLRARMAATETTEPASLTRQIDLVRDSVLLTVEAPAAISAAAETFRVGIHVAVNGEPRAIEVELLSTDPDLEAAPLSRVTTTAEGGAEATLPRAPFGHAGQAWVWARFPGDARLAPAVARAPITLTAAYQLDELSVPGEASPGKRLVLSGRVLDGAGAPAAGVPVTLRDSSQPIAASVSGDQGRFRLVAPRSSLAPGTALLHIEAGSENDARAEAGPFTVLVGEPRPMPLGMAGTALALAALAFAALLVAQRRPWTRWRRTPRVRRLAPGTGSPVASRPVTAPRPPAWRALRTATDHIVAGCVHDGTRDAPLAGAGLRLVASSPSVAEMVSSTDVDGRFSLELPAGTWQLQATAPGHLPATATLVVPHRGELRALYVALEPIRDRLLGMWLELARPLTLGKRPASLTPRELLDRVRARHPAPALASFTDLVEESCFSPRPPTLELLAEASRRKADAAAEAAGQAPGT